MDLFDTALQVLVLTVHFTRQKMKMAAKYYLRTWRKILAAQRKNEAARHNCVIKILPRVSSNLVNYRSNFTIQEKGDGSKKPFWGIEERRKIMIMLFVLLSMLEFCMLGFILVIFQSSLEFKLTI